MTQLLVAVKPTSAHRGLDLRNRLVASSLKLSGSTLNASGKIVSLDWRTREAAQIGVAVAHNIGLTQRFY